MSPNARPPRRATRPADSGMAFVLALFALTTIAMALTSALLVASSDIRATRNYREASQVHFVAESAIAHAMQVVNGPGVVNFQNDVVTPLRASWRLHLHGVVVHRSGGCHRLGKSRGDLDGTGRRAQRRGGAR